MEHIADKVRSAVCRMIVPGDHVLAAVSGGPDSVSLLHLLNEIKGECGFDLSIAHVNHLSRGKDSDEDADFVADLGEKLGLPAYIERVDVAKEKERLKTSFQEAARMLRYQALKSVLQRIGATRLAVGHTADDQAETILLNFLRGSGLKGLAGMPESRGAIIRPLMNCYRTEVTAYLDLRKLKYRVDSSNSSRKYVRNRIRHELIPVLEGFNQNIKAGLLETARIIRDDDECLAEQADRLFAELLVSEVKGKEVILDREKLRRQPLALQKRLLRHAILSIRGNLRRISTHHISKVIDLFESCEGRRQIDLPDHLIAVSSPKGVELRKNRKDARSIQLNTEAAPSSLELKIPGMTEIEEFGLKFQAEVLADGQVPSQQGNPNQACFDFDKIGSGIKARFFKPGDRFVPLGMRGRKKLKSFFIDEKIPRESRRTIPILTTMNDDIIWVYGKRISNNYRVTGKTRNILLIEGGAGSPSAASAE